ncbi:MAG: pstP [Friedmanniella sp.]|nr:pstP [Friedmanniella sp.]
MALALRYAAHSEIGLVRKNNQDSGFASPQLLLVADGMGGAAAGDLASAVAVDTLKTAEVHDGGEQMLSTLAEALAEANDRIADLVEADLTLDGMGTTVTGALFDGTRLGLVHIGDSRAYLLRDGALSRLTHDHSWVQSLIDEGKISVAEAAYHPHRSLLLRVLNGQTANDPDLTLVPVQSGDRLMFCSDGVCGLVDDVGIEEALRRPSLAEATQALVDRALAGGGVDNITVIVADVIDAGEDEALAIPPPLLLGAAAERHIPDLTTTAASTEPTVVTARSEVAAPAGPHEDEARYNPQPPRQRRLGRPLVGVLVLVLIAAAGLGAAYAWTRTQYFVGAAGEQVAIFQGVSEGLPGLRLSNVYEIQPVRIADLPPFYADQVRANIDVASLASARQTVEQLTGAARRCAGTGATPSAGTSSTPKASPSPKPSTTPAATPKPSGSATPSVSTSPSQPTPSTAVSPGAGC